MFHRRWGPTPKRRRCPWVCWERISRWRMGVIVWRGSMAVRTGTPSCAHRFPTRVNVVTGEYLLAVDGRDVPGSSEVFSFSPEQGGSNGDACASARTRTGTGRPRCEIAIDSESRLRHRAWVEDNRRTVSRLSENRLGYVHLPDTAAGGYTSFTRYYLRNRTSRDSSSTKPRS